MSDEDADSAEFTEQARWLIEWHNRRSEAMATRAACLLGFVGVILALLLQGATSGVHPGVLVFVFLGLVVLGLGVCGVASLMALLPRSVGMPEPGNFRGWWSEYAAQPQVATGPGPKIAESLIRSEGEAEESPIRSASKEASDRASSLEVAAWALLLTLLPLTALVVTVLARAGGEA